MEALIRLVHEQPGRFRMKGPTRLQVLDEIEAGEERIEAVGRLLEQLTPDPAT